jgi:hypothetical protein
MDAPRLALGEYMSHQEPYATLSISDDQRYLLCHVTRLPSLQEFRQMVMQIAQTGTRSNLRWVLFDVRSMPDSYGTMQAQFYGESIAELLPGRFCVAILVKNLNPHRKHLETVALNRRLLLKYFTEHDQALTWLFDSGA